MEPEVALPCSQGPATSLYPEPYEPNPHFPFPISLTSILILSPHLHQGLQSSILLVSFSDQNFMCISHLTHSSYMTRPSHPPSFDYRNNIWRSIRVMKLLNVQSSPASCYFFL